MHGQDKWSSSSKTTALVRMAAVGMVEEAGFEVLEATSADEAILLLEARRDITVVFTDVEMPVQWTASDSRTPSGADGRPSRSSRHRAVTPYVTAICRPVGCSCENLTALPRFPAPYGTSRPKPKTRPPATHRASIAEKNRRPLETGSAFSSFWNAATSGPGALRGLGGDGRRRCPTPARTHLAQWRIWL